MYDISNGLLSQDRPRMERTTPDNPCPACGRNGWCLVRPDKTACICMHDGTGWIIKNSETGNASNPSGCYSVLSMALWSLSTYVPWLPV